MQHKHYFVALLCGALCLTGCLKNEESLSVAEVRNAKANELNASAELLKAQATATTVLANANAELLKAQAELEKANALLVKAQADYQQVLADLKAVEIRLQSVKVQEEEIELQKKQAQLELLLAQLAAEQAKAEAEVQAWLNELERLKNEAAVQAITAQQELLEAQRAMEEYMLTAEAEKAEDMREYVETYFGICEALVQLQKDAIDMEVNITNYINGCYDEMDLYEDELNALAREYNYLEATLEYVEQYQSMTPEEKAEKVEVAYEALNEAITAWAEATDAVYAAEDAFDEYTDNNASLYVEGWQEAFINHLETIEQSGIFEGFAIVTEYIQENENEEPVPVQGYWTLDDEGEPVDFVPLWKEETWTSSPYFYLVDLETGMYNPTRGEIYDMEQISPANVFADNVKGVLDAEEEAFKAYAGEAKDMLDEMAEMEKEAINEEIADLDETIELAKAYLETRKPVVDAAEQDLKDAVDAYNEALKADQDAWDAYTEYMAITYDIKRKYFQDVYAAKANKVEKDAAVTEAELNYETAKAKVIPTKEDVYKADLAAAEKEAAYNTAKKAYDDGGTEAVLATAAAKYSIDEEGHESGSAITEVELKTAQYENALKAWRLANVAYTADPTPEKKDALDNAKNTLDDATAALTTANQNLTTAKNDYDAAKKADDNAKKPVEEAQEAWTKAAEAALALKEEVEEALEAVTNAEIEFEYAKADTTIANANLAAKEEALANAFAALDQEGVKYEDDPEFETLYKATLDTYEALDPLGFGTIWDAEAGEWVYAAAAAALQKVYDLYYDYRNKDNYYYGSEYNLLRYNNAAYDVDPTVLFVDGYNANYEEGYLQYTIEWYPRYGYLWEQVFDEDGNPVLDPDTGDPIWEQVFDEDGNPVIDQTWSASYQKAQLEEELEAIPEALAEAKAVIDALVEAYVSEVIDPVRENLAVLEGWQPDYSLYCTKKQELQDEFNEAFKTYVDAYYEFLDAKAAYKALANSYDYFYIYEEEWEDYEDWLGADAYGYNVQLYMEWLQEEMADIEAEYEEIYAEYEAFVDDANIFLDKIYMDYDLLQKKIAVFEEIKAKYEAIIEELFGIDL